MKKHVFLNLFLVCFVFISFSGACANVYGNNLPDAVFVYNRDTNDTFDNNVQGYIYQQMGLMNSNGKLIDIPEEQTIRDSDNNIIGYRSADGTMEVYDVNSSATTADAWRRVAPDGTLHIAKHGVSDENNSDSGGGILLDGAEPYDGFGNGTGVGFIRSDGERGPYDLDHLAERPDANITVNVNACFSSHDPDGDGEQESVTESLNSVSGVGVTQGHDGIVYAKVRLSLRGTDSNRNSAFEALRNVARAAGFPPPPTENSPTRPVTDNDVSNWIASLPFESRYEDIQDIIDRALSPLPPGTVRVKLEYSKDETPPGDTGGGGYYQQVTQIPPDWEWQFSFKYRDLFEAAYIYITPGALSSASTFHINILGKLPAPSPKEYIPVSSIFEFEKLGGKPLAGNITLGMGLSSLTSDVIMLRYDSNVGWVQPEDEILIGGSTASISTRQMGIYCVFKPNIIEVNYELPPGWSLMSLPLEPININLNGDCQVIYIYKAGSGYVRKNLSELKAGQGFWILMGAEGGELILEGTLPESGFPTLTKKGWYLLGPTVLEGKAASELIYNYSDVTVIYRYKQGSGYMRSEPFDPGVGYWVLYDPMGRSIPEATARIVGKNFLTKKIGSEVLSSVNDLKLVYEGKDHGSMTTFYIFNVDTKGFVIVAANDCSTPVLGYSYESIFDPLNIPPGLQNFLEAYSDEIGDAVEKGIKGSSEKIAGEWKELSSRENIIPDSKAATVVCPLLTTKWHQKKYYNYLCPENINAPPNCDGHVWAGCGATAMAQVMRYFESPTKGSGTHTDQCNYGNLTVTFSNYTYDWSNMPNKLTSSTPGDEIVDVARIIYHAGVSANTDYSIEGSSAKPYDVYTGLKDHFKYRGSYKNRDNYTWTQWKIMLKKDLYARRPILYRGKNSEGENGHFFVCDGFDQQNRFHFNWGWNGSYNGYYYVSDLTPGTGHCYHHYNRGIFNCYPNHYISGPNNFCPSEYKFFVISSPYPLKGDVKWVLDGPFSFSPTTWDQTKITSHDATVKVYALGNVPQSGSISAQNYRGGNLWALIEKNLQLNSGPLKYN